MGATGELFNISDVGDVREPVIEDDSFGRIDFGEGNGAEAGFFEGESKASDAGEEIEVSGALIGHLERWIRVPSSAFVATLVCEIESWI